MRQGLEIKCISTCVRGGRERKQCSNPAVSGLWFSWGAPDQSLHVTHNTYTFSTEFSCNIKTNKDQGSCLRASLRDVKTHSWFFLSPQNYEIVLKQCFLKPNSHLFGFALRLIWTGHALLPPSSDQEPDALTGAWLWGMHSLQPARCELAAVGSCSKAYMK